MRGIKFRAWDKEQHKMFAVESLDLVSMLARLDCGKEKLFNSVPYVEFPVHVMQYSGLNDKNGKEIYDGDIIKNISGNLAVVKFEKGAFWTSDTVLLCHTPDPEVVGNAFQDPELYINVV